MTGFGSGGKDRIEQRAADPLAGTSYRVVGVGKSGMGDVYDAEHVELRRRVVAKVMRQALVNDARYLERFRIEAQALAALQHPNIVQVMDFGRTSLGCPYFIMERLVGTTITERLRAGGTQAIPEALKLVGIRIIVTSSPQSVSREARRRDHSRKVARFRDRKARGHGPGS